MTRPEPLPSPPETSADAVASADAAAPPASLTSIPVKRKRSTRPRKGKRGDLTAEPTPAAALPAPAEPAPAEPAAPPAAAEPPPEPAVVASPRVAMRTVETPQNLPEAGAAGFTPLQAEDEIRGAGEFLAYWEKLRAGRQFPGVEEIDRTFVSAAWQDSMIVDFAFAPTMPHIARLGRPSGAVAYMPLMTDWILSRGRQAARRGVPLDEMQVFEDEGESLHFRVLLLPLGTANGASDCVLCHLSRTF